MDADIIDLPTDEDLKIWKSDFFGNSPSHIRVRNEILRIIDSASLSINDAIEDGWLDLD